MNTQTAQHSELNVVSHPFPALPHTPFRPGNIEIIVQTKYEQD